MSRKKILRKSIAGLISAGTILCACPQTYAKTESTGQRILNGAKAVEKYVTPAGIALVMGLIGGAEYRKYQDNRIKKKSLINQPKFAETMIGRCVSLQTWYAMEAFDPYLINRTYDNLITGENGPYRIYLRLKLGIANRISEDVLFERGDKILVIGETDGNALRTRDMLLKAIDHILKDDGKVVFLGNVVSQSIAYTNLESILQVIELKHRFPSNVLILRGDNERELLKDRKRIIPIDENRRIPDKQFEKIRELICSVVEKYMADNKNISDNIYCGKIYDSNLLRSGKEVFTLDNISFKEGNSSTHVLNLKYGDPDYKYITID